MPQNTIGHTPGPWRAARNCVVSPKPQVQIAFCGANSSAGLAGFRSVSEAEAEANARLMAAAPDMLAALKGLVENPAFELGSPKVSGRAGGEKRDAAMTAWDGFVEAARTALSKAEAR